MKKVFKSLLVITLVTLFGFLITNFMQAEAAASGDSNPCDGNSLVATYYGKEINLLDYAKLYANEPSIRKDYCKSYKGFETDGVYYNSSYNNYKYFINWINYFMLDVEKNDPITSFVNAEYLHKEGDWGLIGNEYGYYIHSERFYSDEISVTTFKDINNSYLISSTSINPDIEIYKSTVTVVKYDMDADKVGSNLKYSLTPLILFEMEFYVLNNNTSYSNILIQNVIGQHFFIHSNGWNVFPHFIDRKDPTYQQQDRERFLIIENMGYDKVYLPALRFDYCLYKNAFLACEEQDDEIYKKYAQKILDSFYAYGIIGEKNPIDKINTIDFSKNTFLFTLNGSAYFYSFEDGEYITESHIKAPADFYNTEEIGTVPVHSFEYNGVEIKYHSKECISEIQANLAYYKRVNHERTDNRTTDQLQEIGLSMLKTSWDGFKYVGEKQASIVTVIVDCVKVGIEVYKFFAPGDYETKSFDNALVIQKVNSHGGLAYIDEYYEGSATYTCYLEPVGSRRMMNNPNYAGMFKAEIDGAPIYSLENGENKLQVKAYLEYYCQFGRVQKDGTIKNILVKYITQNDHYSREYILGETVKELTLPDKKVQSFSITDSRPTATFYFDLEHEKVKKGQATFIVEKSGYYSLNCWNRALSNATPEAFEIEVTYNGNKKILKENRSFLEFYLKAGENCVINLDNYYYCRGNVYIAFSSPEQIKADSMEYEFELSGNKNETFKQFTIDAPTEVEIMGYVSDQRSNDYRILVYKTTNSSRELLGTVGPYEDRKLILKDTTATYTIIVQDNRISRYDGQAITVFLDTKKYKSPRPIKDIPGKPPIIEWDGVTPL